MPRNNALASHNGREVELQVLSYLGIDHLKEPVDSNLLGHPVEIKSCQQYVEDMTHSNGRRRGRFLLDPEQHQYLLANRGSYIFIVRDASNIIKSRILRAELVRPRSIERVLQIPWHKVIP